MNRLAADERRAADAARDLLGEPGEPGRAAGEALDKLLTKADSYAPLTLEAENLEFQPETYARVWAEAEQLRHSGQLLELGRQIRCPVVAIHGDHDPHPADGIRVPLSAVIKDFRFVLLQRCGHTPWIERYARDPFFRVVEDEVR